MSRIVSKTFAMEKLKVIFIVIPPSLGEQSDDESWDLKKISYRSDTPVTPSPPSPKFKTLLPGEKIDFATFRGGVTAGLSTLEDQCQRLMGSLEESHRANEAVTAERDHYKEFWSAMNNYHTVVGDVSFSSPCIVGRIDRVSWCTPLQSNGGILIRSLPTIWRSPLPTHTTNWRPSFCRLWISFIQCCCR